ncbi:MAG: hypothetical protein ACI9J2_001236 [Saprospiraceae bacterium]|jgi:hypothetical protein
MLVSFDFSSRQNIYQNIRCDQLTQVDAMIRNNLAALGESGHQKWREVDLDLKIGDWKRNRCSSIETQINIQPVVVSDKLNKDMSCIFLNDCS